MAKDLFEEALKAEGITGQLADLARSVYRQESSSGKNAKDSNAGAVGGMQIRPGTFREVADKDWSIRDPLQNARAGIRYLKKMNETAGGNLELTAVGYYGGPGGIAKAKKGVAVADPRNPNAPDTREYARQVVARMPGSVLGLPDEAMTPQLMPRKVPDVRDFYNYQYKDVKTSVAPSEPSKAALMAAQMPGRENPDVSIPQIAAQEQLAQLGAIQANAVENPWKAFQMLKASNLGSGMNYGVKANAPEVDFSKFGRFGERKA